MLRNVVAVAVGASHVCTLTNAGAVTCWGDNQHGQLGDGTTTSRGTPVVVIGLTESGGVLAAGDYHACMIADAGEAKCWGWDGYGQLGLGTITERWMPVDMVATLFAPYVYLPLARK